MRREIAAVVLFLKRHVKGEELEWQKVELFAERLAVALRDKFKGHWYPEEPSRGQAYRCIRINRFYQQDQELLRACRESGIQYSDLGLPHEFTLWVDPGEVCCRYREHIPCFTVATFSHDEEDEKDVAKVNSALERVSSDYHSGSSSDEESRCTSPVSPYAGHSAQQVLNPNASAWYPNSRLPGIGHMVPRSPNGSYGKHPHSFRNKVWAPQQK